MYSEMGDNAKVRNRAGGQQADLRIVCGNWVYASYSK